MDPFEAINSQPKKTPNTSGSLSVPDLRTGILTGNRTRLAQAITLIESNAPTHQAPAQELLRSLLPHSGKAHRIGITGSPGVGKSTFIEALGTFLVDTGHLVAVLTIDPSSTRSGGSILGDKTRMEQLSRNPNAFIRPSPAGLNLGGVARRTRETILLCEAAGFNVVLVESVGVGQTEIALRSMVDFFLLLLLPGAGDELQSIKKGVVELADGVWINKADGDNRLAAAQARAQQENALHYLQPATPPWRTQTGLCSALSGEGVPAVWEQIDRFYRELQPQGIISKRREQQALAWLSDLIHEELRRHFYDAPHVQNSLPLVQERVLRGVVTPVQAAQELLHLFYQNPPHPPSTAP